MNRGLPLNGDDPVGVFDLSADFGDEISTAVSVQVDAICLQACANLSAVNEKTFPSLIKCNQSSIELLSAEGCVEVEVMDSTREGHVSSLS